MLKELNPFMNLWQGKTMGDDPVKGEYAAFNDPCDLFKTESPDKGSVDSNLVTDNVANRHSRSGQLIVPELEDLAAASNKTQCLV